HTYHDANGTFPWARKFDQDQSFTWYHLILPYMDQENVYRQFTLLPVPKAMVDHGPSYGLPADTDYAARTTTIRTFFCPSDTGPLVSWVSEVAWARSRGNYRGC